MSDSQYAVLPLSGLDPTGENPASKRIQEALDTVGANGGGTVLLPPGKFYCDRPIWMRYPKTRLLGAGTFDTTLQGNNNGAISGPILFLGPDAALQENPAQAFGLSLVDTLLPTNANGAKAVRFDTTHSSWPGCINLNENGRLNLNGLSKLTVECWINFATLRGDCTLLSCASQHSYDQDYIIYLDLSITPGDPNYVTISILTSNGYFYARGGQITPGVTTHLAGVYDGSTLKLFVKGSQVASVPATGTLVMPDYEDVIIGGRVQIWPLAQGENAAPDATIDCVKIYPGVLYTENFTPSTDHADYASGAGNTTAPFAQAPYLGRFLVGPCAGHLAYLPLVNCTFDMAYGFVAVENVTINGHGSGGHCIYAETVQNFRFDSITTVGGSYGIEVRNNCYEGEIANINLSPDPVVGKIGLAVVTQSSLIHVRRGRIRGIKYGLVLSGGGASLHDCYITDSKRAGIYVMDADDFSSLSLYGSGVSDENSSFSEAGCYLSGIKNFLGAPVGITVGTRSIPAIWADKDVGICLVGGVLGAGADAEIIHFSEPPSVPATVISPHTNTPQAPWSNYPASLLLIEGGKLSGVKGLSSSGTTAHTLVVTGLITGLETFVDITFSTAELDEHYSILPGVSEIVSGTPEASSLTGFTVSNKTTAGFRATVPMAPGSQAVIQVVAMLMR